ncbi:MAG: hypothetical protein KC493_13185 [Bacteriovoracaceae bacterium]|nr:hypothetical protein [Bacteriovoracaceae bacterium]
MKMHQAEDQLINLLMEETFSDSESKETSNESGDLLSYFNTENFKSKLNATNEIEDLFKRRQVTFAKANLNSNKKVIRFGLNSENLDVPTNWSIFQKLSENEGNYLYRSGVGLDDKDYLFEVLTTFLGGPREIGFIKFDGIVYLVHTKVGTEETLEWIENFLFPTEISAAA